MNSLEVIPDTSAIESHSDPGQFVVLCLDRAKTWLTEALEHGDINKIIDVKSQAQALRMYTAQKQIGQDAELAATEIVRRAERGIGLAIRKGQMSGEIGGKAAATAARIAKQSGNSTFVPRSPYEFVPHHELCSTRGGIYGMTDAVSDAQFESAIKEARKEQNLSRANVVRKAKGMQPTFVTKAQRIERIREMASQGYRASQIAPEINISEEHVRLLARQSEIKLPDSILGNTQKINPNRVVRETVVGARSLTAGLELLNGNIQRLDKSLLDGWISSLSDSLQQLNSLLIKLKEVQ